MKYAQMQNLIDKLNSKEAVIGILGLGYVGLPLALRYSKIGYPVIGIDIDNSKIDALNDGKTYIQHIQSDMICTAKDSGFYATTAFSSVKKCDALIICVPTPLSKHREPDLSFVTATMDAILPYLRPGQVISLESTTYPGTTEEELLPKLEASGFNVGKDIALVYSPEREDPGNLSFETSSIPKVCGGHTETCLTVGIALYSHAIERVVPVSSTKVAEMTKLLENIHRAVNIGLVNEMKIVADKMGIDIYEVIDAAATKPFGFTPFYPGPGLGGHCIPIDPFYLTWKAREYDLHTRFIELAGEINQTMPVWVVNKVSDALNARGKPLRDSNILVLGIAYKKNVDDMRESPSVKLMELMEEKGALVSYSDPHVPSFPIMRDHKFQLDSEIISSKNLQKFDAVVLATDHDKFDYELISESAQLIIDTRGKYRTPQHHIIQA